MCLTRRENIVCDPKLGNDFRNVSIFSQSAPIFVKLTRVGISGAMADSDNEQIFKLAGMMYYVDPKAVGTMGFLGNKERIQIPINSKHSSLEALKGN